MASLKERQEAMRDKQMKERNEARVSRLFNLHKNNSELPNISVIPPEQRTTCTICKRRWARRGQTVCSRCTVKGQQEALRDTLPDLPVKEPATTAAEKYGYAVVSTSKQLEELKDVPEEDRQYTRKDVSNAIGVSMTTLMRWESKGYISPPRRTDNKYIYTHAQLEEARAYKNRVLATAPDYQRPRVNNTLATEEHQEPRAGTLDDFASKGAKFGNVGKKIEKSLARRLGDSAGRKLL